MKIQQIFSGLKNSFAILLFLIFIAPSVCAQQATTATLTDKASLSYNQISKASNVIAYPAKGQTQDKQKNDEYDCYKWAYEQTGIDILNPPKVQAAPVDTAPKGEAVKGAARGAAVGAAVGAVTGDAGDGAAVGAIAGGVSGRRQAKHQKKAQAQQASAGASTAEKDMKDKFSKAFSVCMEGKGYTIK
ncbi:glycine zipper family protein [Flavobacterium sp.]|uniref:glycine zipper family protein n=1 Tax=Flavobacterium sp. TaxID=239 RepID=UPI002BED053F|nr:glycine zipper family protein [Flavobacterium sp.]HSD08959.1 glycine zipper family protein [Flavobacterium sp.]